MLAGILNEIHKIESTLLCFQTSPIIINPSYKYRSVVLAWLLLMGRQAMVCLLSLMHNIPSWVHLVVFKFCELYFVMQRQVHVVCLFTHEMQCHDALAWLTMSHYQSTYVTSLIHKEPVWVHFLNIVNCILSCKDRCALCIRPLVWCQTMVCSPCWPGRKYFLRRWCCECKQREKLQIIRNIR